MKKTIKSSKYDGHLTLQETKKKFFHKKNEFTIFLQKI